MPGYGPREKASEMEQAREVRRRADEHESRMSLALRWGVISEAGHDELRTWLRSRKKGARHADKRPSGL